MVDKDSVNIQDVPRLQLPESRKLLSSQHTRMLMHSRRHAATAALP